MENFLVFIIALTFIGFITLLVIGAVIKSIPLLVSSFILAFIGYAIAEHDSTH